MKLYLIVIVVCARPKFSKSSMPFNLYLSSVVLPVMQEAALM